MILKIGETYFDVEDIEVEKQIKLFEEIAATQGDFSYSFELPNDAPTRMALGMPFPDNQDKTVYTKTECELQDNGGNTLYKGSVRVEGVYDVITCSFFSGNNNWFSELSGPLSDIDFSDLTVDQNISAIIASANNTDGITWPIVDNGGLATRGYQQMMAEDFVPGIYVHTVFKRIFQKHSIKIQGELLDDPFYRSLTTHKNVKSTADLDANACYVQKTTTTARPVENVPVKVTFQNDSVYPYYDGSADSFDLTNSRYIAPYKMRIDIECSLRPSIVNASYNNRIYLYINGVFTFVDVGLFAGGLYNSATAGDIDPFTLKRTIVLEAGDILEIYSEWQQSGGSTQNDVLSGYLKITPVYIYQISGLSVIPNWTQQQYVSNILRLFNTITYYEPFSKTLTINLFDKIPGHTPVNISPYITNVQIDYQQFISNYGKRNTLSYNQVDFEDLRDYNIQNFFKYGQGSIAADNDFLTDSVDILESDFSNPLGYLHPIFDMSMEKLDIIRLDEGESVDITLVSSSAGQAVFSITSDIFLAGDLVRVSESSNPRYNGDYVVDVRSAGSIELINLDFDTDATGKITKLTHSYQESDDVYLLSNIKNYPLSNFSGKSSFLFDRTSITEHSLAFFSILFTGRTINTDFKQGLSFGDIQSPFFYQRTLIDTYWRIFSRMLNDPVMLLCENYLPLKVYNSLTFLTAVEVKTLETTNLYYVNRMTGYVGSEKPCALELIKLP